MCDRYIIELSEARLLYRTYESTKQKVLTPVRIKWLEKTYGNGAAGGSGLVVIRYADTFADAASTTGSPTFTTTGGYKIYKWTGSGSITF